MVAANPVQGDHVRNDPFGSALSPRGLSMNALFAALLAASAVLAVQIPGLGVPLTFQVLVVVLVALIVPPSWAALAVGTYLIAGAIGLPVFARAHGGLPVLLGPSGGYLIGFLIGAVAGAWVRARIASCKPLMLADAVAAVIVIACSYLVGWLHLMVVTGAGPLAALLGGVVPFVVPDVLKAFGAVAMAPIVRKASGL